MCGIFAYFQKGFLSPEKVQELQEYFSTIQHRGPDNTNTTIVSTNGYSAFIGFHRLAIIDPSAKSDGVLHDDGVYLVCNGEIYNYQYLIQKYQLQVTTGSDCEVILQLYRKFPTRMSELMNELDGVFAFVLYDKNTHTLVVGRDRIGVRPIFQAESMASLTFASEGKAVPSNTAEPFSPGYMVTVNLLDWTSHYTKWYKPTPIFRTPLDTAQTVVRELFISAVRKRLVADRPVGFLVSGGLDSSLVASVATRLLGKPITTFSIGLAESPDLLAARKVAQFLNSNHHEIIISTDDVIDALPKVVKQIESYDITTIRASIPMYLISQYIREKTDIKVIFSGEGADELFGGYLYFHKAPGYTEFQQDTVRLLEELYKYDVLRSDRTTAVWGLELRVPFLDADLLSFVSALDPAHKMPTPERMEKAILRQAFDGFLPNDILWRVKEAFSDAVGVSSVRRLKEYSEQHAPTTVNVPDHCAVPHTAEARYYYKLFSKYYNDRELLHTEKYWMPSWHDVTDPSATVLSVHPSQK